MTDESKNHFTKALSIIAFIVFIIMQLWLLFKLQLFGDEAFYWLESQHLDWSYSELPGWTAWMIRIGTDLLGRSYFSVRSISYLGFLSIFLVGWKLNKLLSPTNDGGQFNVGLIYAVPLVVLVAVMALPDIWLIFFVMWISYFLIKAVKFNKIADWIIVGFLLALSMNVHVRMWIWIFFAGLTFLYVYRSNSEVLKSGLVISLPIALLGFIPIVLFNYQHEFVLFSFQFGRRNPWQFQAENISFLLSQFIVVTPLVLFLFFNNLKLLKKQIQNKPIYSWMLVTALIHWLFYVVMSLFSDGLRTTVHWVLISYIPVLIISNQLLNKNRKIIKWAIITGGLTSLALLILLNIKNDESSNLQARLLDNSLGWHELSIAVKRIQQQQQIQSIITDYFMTAAELAFELNEPNSIKVLPHPKNVKHGRQKQLEIMGMLLDKPREFHKKSLLVIEDSTLKLQNKGSYYAQLCQYFQSLIYLETVSPHNTNKQFHIFTVKQTGNHTCEIPPLFYVESLVGDGNIVISGWAILHETGIQSLTIVSGDHSIPVKFINETNLGIDQSFPEIDDPDTPNNGFKITMPVAQIEDESFKIQAISKGGRSYFSQIYYLN